MITLTVLLQEGQTSEIDKAIALGNNGKWCAENAMFTLDGISFFPSYDISSNPYVFAVNNRRTSNKIIYRMEDNAVIESSMSKYSLKKFKRGIAENRTRLINETREVLARA